MDSSTPQIFVDLDETLVHTVSLGRLALDIRRLMGDYGEDEFGIDREESIRRVQRRRQDFDDKVKAASAVAAECGPKSIVLVERQVAARILEERGWRRLNSRIQPEMLASLRPGSIEFLGRLGQLAPVHLCTNATTQYALGCLEAFGIRDRVSEVFAREQVFETADHLHIDRFLLIDDLPTDHPILARKLEFLGAPDDQCVRSRATHLHVPPWLGDGEDRHLAFAIERIRTWFHEDP